jgi:hypothetical protein
LTDTLTVRLPPLLREHPRWLQALLAIVLPAAFGAVTGYFLGISAPTYLALSLFGLVGAVGAGFDHAGAGAGAKRGLVAGSIFGAAILVAHELHGAEAEVRLPEPAVLLLLFTTLPGIAFAALGGWLRGRVRAGAAPAGAA